MQQSPFLRALAAVLFTAVCAWLLAAFMPGAKRYEAALSAPPAGNTGAAEGLPLDGIVIRSERLLSSDEAVHITARDAERLPAGAAAAFAGDEPVLTRSSALFFSDTDGYEYLSPAALDALTADKLAALMSAAPQTESGTFGRLVSDFAWYYAAAPQNGTDIDEGSCKIRFEGFDEALEAELISSAPGAVVLRLTDGAAEYLRLRQTKAELLLNE